MKRNKSSTFFSLKSIRNITIIALMIFFIYNGDGGSPNPALAFETTGSSMGIEIVPDHELFNVGNMAPGEKTTRRLTVKNKGQYRFKYNILAVMKDGSELLFNNLNLEIKDVANNNSSWRIATEWTE